MRLGDRAVETTTETDPVAGVKGVRPHGERKGWRWHLGTWLVTATGNLYLVLGTVIFGLLALPAGLLPPRGDWVFSMSKLWSWGLLAASGVRVRVSFEGPLPRCGGYVFLANHQSMFDIPIIGALLFSNYPKYVSKKELSRGIPSISYNLRRGGNALIDRSDRTQAERAIHDLGVCAERRGVSVVIYPEGTRARAGGLGPFKRAGTFALLAAAPDLDVVPVVIDGSWKLLTRNLFPVPFGVRIRVRFADPIRRSGPGDAEAIFDRTRREIESTLLRWRSEAADHARSR